MRSLIILLTVLQMVAINSLAAAKPPATQAAPSTSSAAKDAPGAAESAQTVYVTKTGAKYHRAGLWDDGKISVPAIHGE